MKTQTLMEEEKLIRTAVDSLIEKLGAVEAQRFLALPGRRRMDSVRRHHLWQARLKKDAFFDRAKAAWPKAS